MAPKNNQPHYLQRYFSLGPWLAVLAISVAFTIWVLINAAAPDLLFYPGR